MSQDLFKTGVAVGGTIGSNLVVTLDSSTDGVKLPAAATNYPFGVTAFEAAAGETISVQTEGEVRVFTSAIVARGAAVKAGTDGKIATATTGDVVIGYCLQGAAANELAHVYISRGVAA